MTEITFTPEGTARCLFTETIDLSLIGRLAIKRATHIEYDNNHQYWRVKVAGRPLFNSPSRQACLAWEQQYLEQQEDLKHELQYGADSVAAGA